MSNLSIVREKKGSYFIYRNENGENVSSEINSWITSLAIPPAWKEVRVASSPQAKVLAIGQDNAGRQQAIYNPTFRARQEKKKFDRILRFADALPRLRQQLSKDLSHKKLDKAKVLACIVKLIDEAYFRIGNERYAQANNSYGITTLRSKHLEVSGATVTFDFIGKSGQKHVKQITDRQIARIVKQLDDLPGYEIFRYQDEGGTLHDIDSKDVNAYIKEYMGEEFTAKDFRTWGGTLVATTELLACELLDTKDARKKMVTSVVKTVAKRLGNTPAIARSSYIDPRVIAAYVDSNELGRLRDTMKIMRPRRYVSRDEQCLTKLLNGSHIIYRGVASTRRVEPGTGRHN